MRIQTEQADKIKVTCTITHEMGHSESTSLSADPDTSGSKNPIQAIGSTISYLERYTILALCGLATSDIDKDAQSEPEYIDDKQMKTILDLIDEVNADQGMFLTYMGVEKIADIQTKDYEKAIKALELKKSKMREPGMEG